MKYCIKCGTKLPDIAVFCPLCGQKQPELEEGGIVEPIEQEEVPAPVIEAAPPIEEAPIEEPAEVIGEPAIEEPEKFGEPEDPGEAIASKKPIQISEGKPSDSVAKKPEKPANPRKKGGIFIDPEPMKLLLIFTGALFGGSLLFWVIGAFISVFILAKLVILFFALWRSFKVTWTIVRWFMASKGKEKDMFTMLLMFCVGGITGLLLILNTIYLFM